MGLHWFTYQIRKYQIGNAFKHWYYQKKRGQSMFVSIDLVNWQWILVASDKNWNNHSRRLIVFVLIFVLILVTENPWRVGEGSSLVEFSWPFKNRDGCCRIPQGLARWTGLHNTCSRVLWESSRFTRQIIMSFFFKERSSCPYYRV